MGKETF